MQGLICREPIGQFGADLRRMGTASKGLDGGRAPHIGQRARLALATDIAEIVAQRVLGVGPSRAVAEDLRRRQMLTGQGRYIGPDDGASPDSERSQGRAAGFGAVLCGR